MTPLFDICFETKDFLAILKQAKIVKSVGKRNLAHADVRVEFINGVASFGLFGAEYHLNAKGMANCAVLIPVNVWQGLRRVPPSTATVQMVYQNERLKINGIQSKATVCWDL